MNISSMNSVSTPSDSSPVGNPHGPHPVVPAKKEVVSGRSPSMAEPAAQANTKEASDLPPTSGTGDVEDHPAELLQSPIERIPPQHSTGWYTVAGPHYDPPTKNDGEHWRKLYEKVDRLDKEFYDRWISEIDSIPTFAGLLAGVVTAFAIESYKLLQPDPQKMVNHTLLNISAQLAGGNTTELPSFTPSSSSLRVNLLWFLSLTCILMAGLVAVLSKQWLRQYRRQDFSMPHQDALALHQLRLEGILKWKVTGIFSALPILLTLGLILFFIGLIDFLYSLGAGLISIPITILIGVGFAFLVVTTSAPAFQYAIASYSRRSWEPFRPALFAFKSPQSLAILHFATWLFPLPDKFKKLPNWTSWEFAFFSNNTTVGTYTWHALSWIHETYSHSLDTVYQVCLCLQDIEDQVYGDSESIGKLDFMLRCLAREEPEFQDSDSTSGTNQPESHGVAMRYLSSEALEAMSFDQILTILKRSMHALDRSSRQVPSFDAFRSVFVRLSNKARNHPDSPQTAGLSEQFHQVILQRAILFQKLLSEKRWTDPTKVPMEVRHVFENFKLFSNENLSSILNAVRVWIDQHQQDASLPTHCWVSLTSQLKPHELEEALQNHPPVRDFMAFLDSRFQMGIGVKYLCHSGFWYNREEEFRSFFTALYAWIERNPQVMQLSANRRTLLTTMNSSNPRARKYQSFHDFRAFLENLQLIWTRAIRFQNLLSAGSWEETTSIPEEVWEIFMNLKVFTDEDLDSIFNALRKWIDQHPLDAAGLPSGCWAILTSRLKPYELEEVLRYRPPVRDFMAFLDSRLQMVEGVEYLCRSSFRHNSEEEFSSFFTALHAWIRQNPQDTQSFVRCQTSVTALGDFLLNNARKYPSFRDFEDTVEQVLSHRI